MPRDQRAAWAAASGPGWGTACAACQREHSPIAPSTRTAIAVHDAGENSETTPTTRPRRW
ncbi:hypothetical protein Ae717Ps2_7190c [Pseudonocardia sp. Ae717_Ps2]|uniref:hypothetical protein n=1 Tax=Pseudonocardia sp. Ae717_Ps2 TaxID=1885573 RepID=UPI00095C4002|nr:hypothetical protein [Pseudonocardia sp. Ae717_Ps2]OLM27705.1 hypothetical protein Ae717Ps2_7190c [Pseudonocardia sp. Ae717_Ps2]